MADICYDLPESPFVHEWGEWRFYFSTAAHLRNFIGKIDMKIAWLNDSFSRRFRFNVDASVLAVFQLYNQIENRGFYVVSVTGNELVNPCEVFIECVM